MWNYELVVLELVVGSGEQDIRECGHAPQFLWPKILNSQSIFWKSNFLLWMPTLFWTGPKQLFTTEFHLLNHIQKVLVFPKWDLISKLSIGEFGSFGNCFISHKIRLFTRLFSFEHYVIFRWHPTVHLWPTAWIPVSFKPWNCLLVKSEECYRV